VKAFIDRFASLRVTVTLLVVLLVALAAGTIVESLRGAEAAGRAVYRAPWFYALLAVFALNLACSLVSLWPWGSRRIGYATTHLSMLVILAGALATELGKTEGLHVWEGGGDHRDQPPRRPEAEPPVVTTAFAVRLDAFEIDYYEGTRRPAQFRSRVTVKDARGETPAVIEMNRELAYGGYKFFQSSYRETPGRDQTILSVSKDPGEPVVFLGYYTLVAGMVVVLVTRIRERRRALQPAAASVPRPARRGSLGATIHPAVCPSTWSAASPRCSTTAGSAIRHARPRGGLGTSPAGGACGAIDPGDGPRLGLRPAGVGDPADRAREGRRLAAAIGLARARWSSFEALAGNTKFMELMSAAQAKEQQERPLVPLEKAAQKVEGRLLWMQQLFDQSALRVVPAARPGEAWTVPEHVHSAADLRTVLDSGASAGRLPAERASVEILYNRARPTRIAWWVLTLSLLLSIAAMATDRRALDLVAGAFLFAGFAVMSWGIGMRWQVAGRIPASNMYESLLFLGWGVGLFAVVATFLMRNRLVVLNAAAGAALTMALTDLLPIDRFIHPMPPVLSGTYWLAIHVPIIMVGYAVLALGMVVAHMQIGVEAFLPARRSTALKMAELQYYYIHVGSILLVAGILTGSMWAASSWGRYWGWDPKEVWSLVAFLAYMAILHARAERLIGPFGVAAWSIVAFQTILMTYLGVNFVLASGLHSYGFGDSSVVRAMVATALVEAAFLGIAWARVRKPVPS
jgi:ABC-type transport system involved in cytochrome c biogenesis permease subunit